MNQPREGRPEQMPPTEEPPRKGPSPEEAPSEDEGRVIDPSETPPPEIEGDKVAEASWESFPASDAPAWRGGSGRRAD